ncbi:MAG: hypothetical protein Q7S55_00615 [Nanoarchaeota archaeon]|nr:hypothetical protein [Nanoarchaeota archaeon]
MKLTIDTQVDTHEDIRKILQILTSILEKKDSPVSTTSTDTTDLMSMFGDQKGTVETKGNPPDFSSFLNLSSLKKENKDDEAGIEFY